MSKQRLFRLALLALAGVSTSGASCVLQPPAWAVTRYSAAEGGRGTLGLQVICDARDALTPYTLTLSVLGGRFSPADGAYVLTAAARSGSVLKMQILGASPALGGTIVPTVYTGNQELTFQVTLPAGQWQVSGTTTALLNVKLTPLPSGASLP